MTDLREPQMTPKQRPKRLMSILKTSQPTEDDVRALTRELAVDLDRTPEHDEIIAQSVAVARQHKPLLLEYLRKAADQDRT